MSKSKSKIPQTSKNSPATSERPARSDASKASRPKVLRPRIVRPKAADALASKAKEASLPKSPPRSEERDPTDWNLDIGKLAGETQELAQALSIGHDPASSLSPQDSSLFRSFQSNLLSLISHELRTPLMGILNALTMLEEGATTSEFSETELVAMARRNAQRLHRTLAALLDVAALESKTFHARLREVDFPRLASAKLKSYETVFRDQGLRASVEEPEDEIVPLLADPQKVGRAIELCLDSLVARAERDSEVKVRISSNQLEIRFLLKDGSEKLWQENWAQALAAFQSGVASPTSAFAGTIQSEQGFLSRMEEGLGSELGLVHEILKLHQGKFSGQLQGRKVTLQLEIPELSSDEGIRAVMASRAYQTSTDLSSVALALIPVPKPHSVDSFRAMVKKNLFRASDAVYGLKERGQVAIVMDDCRPEDVPKTLARIEKSLQIPLKYGASTCPMDGSDPDALLELARQRMGSSG